MLIDFYSDKNNLSDLNRTNKDIQIIFSNLEKCTETVY